MTEPLTPPIPTQVKRPWRTTIRSIFQALVAFALIAPLVVDALGLDETAPYVAVGLGAAAGLTRVMAVPQVEAFLQRWLPWLAAEKS